MKTVLLFATTTGYQTRMFSEAAARLGVELVYATDRCDHLDDPWRDGAIAVRFHDDVASADAVVNALRSRPVHGVLVVGDRPTVLAAHVSRVLGLPAVSPDAAATARDKRRLRHALAAAGLSVPASFSVPATVDARRVLPRVSFPVVVKPTVLSGSRGVIRADDADGFVTAFERIQRLLAAPDVIAMHDPEAAVIQIERFIPGAEYAVEAAMNGGALQVLAVFDKPDPLDGPFFEETIYVTPSRAGANLERRIVAAVGAAVQAIGIEHGSVHAECRVDGDLVYVLEVAARPIGGLCARALRFTTTEGATCGLEELLLRQAMGESTRAWEREAAASAVMMIPIPKAGIYRGVDGVDDARAVPGIDAVEITAKIDQRLVPLPEGASYLGFIFARAADPAGAEAAVRHAHARLRFDIDPLLAVVRG